MDASLRNTPALIGRIEKLRDELIQRFEALVVLAKPDRQDRNTSAVVQYQMQAHTAGLIRAAEDVQTLIRQMQEMWLFGQLDTLGKSHLQQQTDDTAKEVLALLQKFTETQSPLESVVVKDEAQD